MLPLNSMLCPGRPPNTAILVFSRCTMIVLNKAHVDAQFPLVTEARSQPCPSITSPKRVPMAILVGSNGGTLGMGTEKEQTS